MPLFEFHLPSLKKYLRNTSWLLAEKIIRVITVLIVGIYIARFLGPTDYGLLNYCYSIVMLFTAFSTLGLDSILVRELVKNPNNRNTLLGTTFTLRFFSSLMVIVLFYSASKIASDQLSETITLIFIISIGLIFQSFTVVDSYFHSKVLSKYLFPAHLTQIILSCILKISLVIFKAPLIYFAIAIVFDSIFLALSLLLLTIKHKLSPDHWNFSLKTAFNLLKDSTPLIASGLVISLYMRIDQIMIKEFLSTQEVGYYAVVVNLSEIWYFIPVVICSSLFPALVEAKNINLKHYHYRLQKLYDLMIAISLLIALPVSIWSGDIIKILFGEEYIQSAKVLPIYIWGNIFVFLGVASGKWLVNENLTKISFYRTLAGAIVNIVLNFYFIPKYGISGAACATLIAQFVAAYAYDIFDENTHIAFEMKTKSLLFHSYLFPTKQ